MNILATFLRSSGVSIIWVCAVFSPVLIIMGAVENKSLHMLLGCVLAPLVLWSILDGIKALKSHQLMTNFIGSALVPIISILVGIVFGVFKYAM